jgi:AcrR family transcriptional regulator
MRVCMLKPDSRNSPRGLLHTHWPVSDGISPQRRDSHGWCIHPRRLTRTKQMEGVRSAAAPGGTGQSSRPRRVPVQRRSRERVERILESATALIAEKGSDAMKMSEVAERADVSIGSLYQYFPDKASIVRTLAERYNAQGLACVAEELAEVSSEEELHAALLRVVDGYYDMFLAEPVMRDIWWATNADKTMQRRWKSCFREAPTPMRELAWIRPLRDRASRGQRFGHHPGAAALRRAGIIA